MPWSPSRSDAEIVIHNPLSMHILIGQDYSQWHENNPISSGRAL
jgi:hypothetical protein